MSGAAGLFADSVFGPGELPPIELSILSRLEEAVLRHAAASGKPHHDNFSGIAVWVGAPTA